MTDATPCYDTDGRRITLVKDVGKRGKLNAILVVVGAGGDIIRLDPTMSKQLALNLVAINLEHDQTDPAGARDNDVDDAIPEQTEDLMVNAFPWYPTQAQRARALELVDVRYHGGDWQTAFISFFGNAVREQDEPQMSWALAQYASEALYALGREEGSKRLRYDLELTRRAAIEEEKNRD